MLYNNLPMGYGTTSNFNAVDRQTHNVMSQLFIKFNVHLV